MSKAPSDRARTLAQLDQELHTMGARSVLLSHATASRLGISPTDLETMDLLHIHGPLTAGRLAELTVYEPLAWVERGAPARGKQP